MKMFTADFDSIIIQAISILSSAF